MLIKLSGRVQISPYFLTYNSIPLAHTSMCAVAFSSGMTTEFPPRGSVLQVQVRLCGMAWWPHRIEKRSSRESKTNATIKFEAKANSWTNSVPQPIFIERAEFCPTWLSDKTMTSDKLTVHTWWVKLFIRNATQNFLRTFNVKYMYDVWHVLSEKSHTKNKHLGATEICATDMVEVLIMNNNNSCWLSFHAQSCR